MEKEAEGQKDDKRDGALCLLSPVPVKSCTERSPVY